MKESELHWEGWEGPEVKINTKLSNDMKILFNLLDARYILTENKLKTARDYEHLRRLFDTIPIFYPRFRPLFKFIDNNLISILRRYKKSR